MGKAQSSDICPERDLAGRLHQLERQVAIRADQVTAANKELEAFVYSVSHDLRSPLHHIGGFAEALADELDGQLSTDARRYLDRIRDGVDQMAGLIDTILDLSRLGRAPLIPMDIDLAALAQSVVQDLRASSQGDFQFELRTEAHVVGDGGLLRQLLEQLLGNAVKFSQRRSKPRIEFGSRDDSAAEGPVFFVADNGVGFDPGQAKKIFAPFTRLHRPEAFEGQGVGLAIAQRIVARHGGRIWADSSPGDGATFYFVVPDLSADKE